MSQSNCVVFRCVLLHSIVRTRCCFLSAGRQCRWQRLLPLPFLHVCLRGCSVPFSATVFCFWLLPANLFFKLLWSWVICRNAALLCLSLSSYLQLILCTCSISSCALKTALSCSFSLPCRPLCFMYYLLKMLIELSRTTVSTCSETLLFWIFWFLASSLIIFGHHYGKEFEKE